MTTSDHSQVESLNTLSQIRKRHVTLMRHSLDARDPLSLIPTIVEFAKQISGFGAALEAEDDRAIAQNMLDYWTSTLVALTKGARVEGVPTELKLFAGEGSRPVLAGENPFRARGAGEADRNALLGREDAIHAVLQILSEHPIVFLSGPVGSGRSSLVLAGVAPRLAKTKGPLEIVPLSLHGDDPIRSLGKIVGRMTAADLGRAPGMLREKLDQLCGDRAALVVVDNVDELFTQCTDPERREVFAKAIAGLAAEPRRHSMILIVRDDWAEALCDLGALRPHAVPGARYSPPPPTAAEIRLILLGSVESAGLRIDPHCVEDLARELQGDPGALSLARFMLLHLWRLSKGGFIGWDAYRQLGRPNDALARVADEVYAGLSLNGKSAAQQLFMSLVKPGLGSGVSCLRESRKALDSGGRDRAMQEALEAFGQAGVIRESAPPDSSDDSLEIVHSSLASRWRRLTGWLEELRYDSERRGRILATAQLWNRTDRQARFLFPDEASIAEARDYVDSTPDSQVLRDFINASVEAMERARRRKLYIMFAITIGVSAFLLAILFGYLELMWYYQRNQRILISNYTNKINELSRQEDSSADEKSTRNRLNAEKELFNSIHKLRNYGDAPVDLSTARLHDLDLSDIDLTNNRFVTTLLLNMNFGSKQEKRDLAYIPFDDSVIMGSHFDNSDLSFTQFLNATLYQTTFSGATLYRAAFDNARLCDVDFSGANLSLATFWNSTMDKATVVSLGNTAWWLAKGWSADQLHELSKQQPVELSQSAAFLAGRKKAEDEIANAPPGNDLSRALALNELAWRLAISKVDLAPKSVSAPLDDTCGSKDGIPSNAQDAASRAAVDDMKKSVEEGYVPTHEFATLARFMAMNGFGDELDRALRDLYPEHKRSAGCPGP